VSAYLCLTVSPLVVCLLPFYARHHRAWTTWKFNLEFDPIHRSKYRDSYRIEIIWSGPGISSSPAFDSTVWWAWKHPHVDGYRRMKKSATILPRIPEDICYMIISYLHLPSDIVMCMALSPAFKAAAMRILRYPHVCRLLKPTHRSPLDVPSGGDTDLEECEGDPTTFSPVMHSCAEADSKRSQLGPSNAVLGYCALAKVGLP
jgi:hypothetical protein